MKKFFALILTLALLFTLPTAAYAAASGTTYRLDELGLRIDIPSDYYTFTRDIDDGDPSLDALGLNKQDLLDSMESSNIYLDAWDAATNCEVVVTMTESTVNDFNLAGDAELDALADAFPSEYEKIGVTVEKIELYQHDQAKFFKLYINQDHPNGSGKIYGLQFYTVYNYKAINVTLQSFSGQIDPDGESTITSIVNTVRFDTPTPPAAESTPPAGQDAPESTPPVHHEEAPESTPPVHHEQTPAITPPVRHEDTSSSSDSGLKNIVISFLVNLALTVVIYSVPIIIYRYAIARQPIEKKRALKITIIYGVIALIVMSCLLYVLHGNAFAGVSILFWSWVNYMVLTSGKAQQAGGPAAWTPQTPPPYGTQQGSAPNMGQQTGGPGAWTTQTPPPYGTQQGPAPNMGRQAGPRGGTIMFCPQCGAKIGENDRFCQKCGARIMR